MASSQDLLRRMLRSDYAELPTQERLTIILIHITAKYRGEREACLQDVAFFSGCTEKEAAAVLRRLEQSGWVRKTSTGDFVLEAP